jgi:hypothetical protein
MPAALLLLLCVACYHRGAEKKVSASQEDLKMVSISVDSSKVSTDYAAQFEENPPEKRAAPPDDAPRQNQSPKPAPSPATNPDWDRKIIKTADLSVETKSFVKFTDRLHRLVRESGGYLSQEEQSQTPTEIDNTVVIKVPVDRFDDLLQQLPADSDQLKEKKVSSQDVSLEVVDTRSRLETKREVRERYLDILKQANKMKDILAIQEQIDGIQEEMDGAAGRIAYLSHASAFSTVNLKFYQVLDAGAVESPTPTFLHKIKLSFLDGWEVVSGIALGLLSVWPLWVVGAIGLGAWRRHRSRLVTKPL